MFNLFDFPTTGNIPTFDTVEYYGILFYTLSDFDSFRVILKYNR